MEHAKKDNQVFPTKLTSIADVVLLDEVMVQLCKETIGVFISPTELVLSKADGVLTFSNDGLGLPAIKFCDSNGVTKSYSYGKSGNYGSFSDAFFAHLKESKDPFWELLKDIKPFVEENYDFDGGTTDQSFSATKLNHEYGFGYSYIGESSGKDVKYGNWGFYFSLFCYETEELELIGALDGEAIKKIDKASIEKALAYLN